ncbi:MAG TPA: DUF4136 domain-containing protein [Gammaproteobacteria bacterium]
MFRNQIAVKLLLSSWISLMSAGCMQFMVSYKSDPNYDYSKIQSYEIVKNQQDNIQNLEVDEAWLGQTITGAIKDSLDSKGLSENPEQAQVVVSYYVVVAMTVDTLVVDNYYNHYYQYSTYPTAAIPDYRKITYNKGTLVIDVVDKASKQIVWRGAADTVVREQTDNEQREKNIRKAVTQIFKQFPR